MLSTTTLFLLSTFFLALSLFVSQREDAYLQASLRAIEAEDRIGYQLKAALYASLVGSLAIAAVITLGFAIAGIFR